MEIYTQDLVDVASETADDILLQIAECNSGTDYFIHDACDNLQRKIRKYLYDKLSTEFTKLAQETQDAELNVKLHKIINEL